MGHVQPLTVNVSVSPQVQANKKPDPWATAGTAMALVVQSPSMGKVGAMCFALC